MELKIQTNIGEMTGIFDIGFDGITAWFKEDPRIIVEGKDINEAVDQLLIGLDVVINFDISELLK